MTINPYILPGIPRMDIVKAVCNEYNITTEQFYSKTRKQPFAEARQVVMWYKYRVLRQGSSKIATSLGIKSHVTVLHGIKTISNYLETDKDFREKLDDIIGVVGYG